jgi:ElaB/YqjD/DUF883 family membrane-anchored ribosome-binding protein
VSALRTVAETALEVSQDVKKSATEFGRTAGKTIHKVRDQTSDALHDAASSVRHGSAKIENIAKATARRLDATASFVEDFNLKNASAAVERFGRKHSRALLLAGVVVGFWAGSTFSRGRTAR